MIRLAALLIAAALPGATLPAAAQSIDMPFSERFTPATPAALKRVATGPTLRSAVMVTGEIVRIGDLIENAGAAASVPIFRAPDLGESGTVPANQIVDAVLTHGLPIVDTRDLTEVMVTRASRAI